jgi:D-alanyl-D-alanine carboxypeptidase (penicillin-binding protein 5/6)
MNKSSAFAVFAAAALFAAFSARPATAAEPSIAQTPYIGAIVVDANTGEVLREDRSGRPGYPASMLKLMNLFVTLDAVSAGRVSLADNVHVTQRAASWGGSQVWLDPRESFPLEELLYAMMVQSANDAAFLVAEHVAGSGEAFVDLMNAKAKTLGLSAVTHFVTPHGLPPKTGRPDLTTAADFAKLCTALLREHPEALRYTSVTYRQFRPDSPKPMDMRTHNPLLTSFPGCDGLKTGYFSRAGYSIAVTAERDGRRAIAVILGSSSKSTRNDQARSWLEYGLANAKPKTAAPTPPPSADPSSAASAQPTGPVAADAAAAEALAAAEAADAAAADSAEDDGAAPRKSPVGKILAWLGVILVAAWAGLMVLKRRLLVSRQANVHVRK